MNLSVKQIDFEKIRSSNKLIYMNQMVRLLGGSKIRNFETDEQIYLPITLPARHLESNAVSIEAKTHLINTLEKLIAFGNGADNGARDAITILHETVHERVKEMLTLLLEKKKRSELVERMGLSNQTKNGEKYLDPLIHLGWVLKEFEEDTHPSQRYYSSERGKRILELM